MEIKKIVTSPVVYKNEKFVHGMRIELESGNLLYGYPKKGGKRRFAVVDGKPVEMTPSTLKDFLVKKGCVKSHVEAVYKKALSLKPVGCFDVKVGTCQSEGCEKEVTLKNNFFTMQNYKALGVDVRAQLCGNCNALPVQRKVEEASEASKKKASSVWGTCSDCSSNITSKPVFEKSKEYYGRVICWKCQEAGRANGSLKTTKQLREEGTIQEAPKGMTIRLTEDQVKRIVSGELTAAKLGEAMVQYVVDNCGTASVGQEKPAEKRDEVEKTFSRPTETKTKEEAVGQVSDSEEKGGMKPKSASEASALCKACGTELIPFEGERCFDCEDKDPTPPPTGGTKKSEVEPVGDPSPEETQEKEEEEEVCKECGSLRTECGMYEYCPESGECGMYELASREEVKAIVDREAAGAEETKEESSETPAASKPARHSTVGDKASNVTCGSCGEKGHRKNQRECPNHPDHKQTDTKSSMPSFMKMSMDDVMKKNAKK